MTAGRHPSDAPFCFDTIAAELLSRNHCRGLKSGDAQAAFLRPPDAPRAILPAARLPSVCRIRRDAGHRPPAGKRNRHRTFPSEPHARNGTSSLRCKLGDSATTRTTGLSPCVESAARTRTTSGSKPTAPVAAPPASTYAAPHPPACRRGYPHPGLNPWTLLPPPRLPICLLS